MKKIMIQFAALILVICGIFLFAGHTEGWTEPPEDTSTGDIILSGQKYSGKVVVKITLHSDGTLEHEGNGTITEGTWEAGTGDVAMVAHFPVKGTDYDMEVRDDGAQYVANYPLVADMQLVGSKSGASEEPAATETSATAEAPATTEAPAATEASASEGSSYPANTFVVKYVADINEQLTGTFSSPSSVWGAALGESGSYTPTESEDLLFSWDSTGKSKELDFYANGTYEFRFTKMNITEHGTWRFEDWNLKLTTEAGREITAELTQ